jgi:hypothetical protein
LLTKSKKKKVIKLDSRGGKKKQHKNIKTRGEWERNNLSMMILHPPLC